ncbi:MAG: tetratricopeptide repeat protein [Deltaproteobacteria bacterium]|nr:tetratricopeptide repeat protein [Deltaproteobacteria bacterium]MBW2050971.1 tetratricopeptide repeat protein [Deltaproteobacteria bacterium]MBW2141866.1 tetratricopeptide repeat protein [Deltaproteobacteria bacterium]MBW2322247.1 tetratricopeptide repeat protein [Deltaproteobacteria bacterium]
MDRLEKMEEFKDSLESARAEGDQVAEAAALHGIGRIYLTEKVYDAAEEFLSQCAQLCRESGQREGLAQTLIDLGDLALAQEDAENAEKMFRESLLIYQDNDLSQGQARVMDRIADVTVARGNLDEAINISLDGLNLCRQSADRIGAIYFLEKIIPLYKAKGAVADVEASYRELITFAEELGDSERMAMGLAGLADVYERVEKPEEAVPYLEMAHDIYLRLGKETEAGFIREHLEKMGDS